MKKRIFLTGINGYLAGVLMEQIARLPDVERITGIGLRPPPQRLPSLVNFLKMDVRSPEVTAAMAGHHIVIHTAAVVLWRAQMPPHERDDINLAGIRNLAQAAEANRVPRFLHASSMAVYDPRQVRGQSQVTEEAPMGGPDPFFYYWAGKAAAERVLGEFSGSTSTCFTSLRPIYIIGPRNQQTLKGLRANAVNFPGRDPRRQFIHEDDVAAAFILALRQDLPGAYNVVPDDYLRMREVWQTVGARHVPTVPLWLASRVTWFRWRFLGSPIHPSWVEDILIDFTGSNARLKQTGWQPSHTSATALRSAL